jgi:hypothetical protein
MTIRTLQSVRQMHFVRVCDRLSRVLGVHIDEIEKSASDR